MTAPKKIHVARLALAQLVAEARPDWDRDEFDGIVHSALEPLPAAERPAAFASLALRTARLLGVDDSSAADAAHAGWSPAERSVPAAGDREAVDRAVAAAKSELAGALIAIDLERAGREQAERDERDRQLAGAVAELDRGGDAG
jgi:hypothetical protein